MKRLPTLLLITAIICFAVFAVEAIIQTGSYELVELEFSSEKISEKLDGYRIAFITDPHLDRDASPAQLKRVAGRLREEDVDLLLLGGDYGSKYADCLEICAGIDAADGIYAVLGNHDFKQAAEIIGIGEKFGIRILNNEGVQINDNLYLGGAADLIRGKPDVDKALGQAAGNDFVLLLCHNPDIIEEADCTKADIILSGHTHGGQITFFGLFAPLSSSDHGYLSGLYDSEEQPAMLVSNGLGNVYIPIRAFAMPQVHILTLKK